MAHLSANPRLLSPVCDVVWAGWRTTTPDLQRAGWQLALETDGYDFTTRLLIQHRDLRMRGLSNPTRLDSFRQYQSRPVFHMQYMASEMRVELRESSFSFIEFDAKPQYTNEQIRVLDVASLFATPLVRTEEIIVDPQDVSTMLEQIRKMQAPEMAEIRKREQRRDRRDEVNPGQREVFHAQILSFAA